MTKRNPKLAALLSVIPGLGQFYNKRPIKGTIFFIFFISFISVFYSFLNKVLTQYQFVVSNIIDINLNILD